MAGACRTGRPAAVGRDYRIGLLSRLPQMPGADERAPAGFETGGKLMGEMGDEMQLASRGAITTRGFGTEVPRIGRLIRKRIALGGVDLVGWDTHANQGGASGVLATLYRTARRPCLPTTALLGGLWARQYGSGPVAMARVLPGAAAADLGLV